MALSKWSCSEAHSWGATAALKDFLPALKELSESCWKRVGLFSARSLSGNGIKGGRKVETLLFCRRIKREELELGSGQSPFFYTIRRLKARRRKVLAKRRLFCTEEVEGRSVAFLYSVQGKSASQAYGTISNRPVNHQFIH